MIMFGTMDELHRVVIPKAMLKKLNVTPDNDCNYLKIDANETISACKITAGSSADFDARVDALGRIVIPTKFVERFGLFPQCRVRFTQDKDDAISLDRAYVEDSIEYLLDGIETTVKDVEPDIDSKQLRFMREIMWSVFLTTVKCESREALSRKSRNCVPTVNLL